MEYKSIGLFEAEHAMYTTESEDLSNLFKFIFNTHDYLKENYYPQLCIW